MQNILCCEKLYLHRRLGKNDLDRTNGKLEEWGEEVTLLLPLYSSGTDMHSARA